VIVTAAIGVSQRGATPAARLGYYRVNQAIFGAKGHAVSDSVEPLVTRVAADPSGRTRVNRKVEGRRVSISRSPRGLLVYAVYAN
jgi:hypothetical protein